MQNLLLQQQLISEDIHSCQGCCCLSLAWILFAIPWHFLAWCWNLSCLYGSGISSLSSALWIPWEVREILFVHHLHLPPQHSSNNFFLMSNPFSSDFPKQILLLPPMCFHLSGAASSTFFLLNIFFLCGISAGNSFTLTVLIAQLLF